MTAAVGGSATGRQRALAGLALVCGAVLALLTAVLVLTNLVALLAALLGLGLSVAGAWWLVTEHPPKRWVGLAAVVAGLAIVVAAVVAGADSDRPVLRIVILLVVFGAMVASARMAVTGPVGSLALSRTHAVDPPSHPVLICNPWSGGGKVQRFGIVEAAQALGVETVVLDHGLDLEQLARDAIARGADCLGMAGGDGSQALVASIAVECGVPFVCVSAGTRNHFALDLGIDRDDPRRSVLAFRDAVERRIDYATVNDRFFVNNVSLGVYATIVQEEGYREAKAEVTRSLLPEMLGTTDEPFDLQITTPDGVEVTDTFLIQVSNDPYVMGPHRDATQRRRMDAGRLGVVALSATTGRDAAVIAAAAMARRGSVRGWHEFTAERFEVRSRSGTVDAGVDGEALQMPTPLVFESHPGGLRMLVATGNLEEAARRRARDVGIRQLVAIAMGRS